MYKSEIKISKKERKCEWESEKAREAHRTNQVAVRTKNYYLEIEYIKLAMWPFG